MTTYRVEFGSGYDDDREEAPSAWSLAERWPLPSEGRVFDAGPATGLTREQAEHTLAMLEGNGWHARLIAE